MSVLFLVPGFLALVAVHYAEELMLPVVETARLKLYGNQTYSSALGGCDSTKSTGGWLHPTALALTVYGDTQTVLAAKFGEHSPEVLPRYAKERHGIDDVMCVADYFISTSEVRTITGASVRPFLFEIPQLTYGYRAGWVSGLAQGTVGQVLLAAYLINGDPKYLHAAKEAGRLLLVDIDDGGASVTMPDGTRWFEEYAQPGMSPPLVLNGHLLALDFLYWMSLADPDGEWNAMFESGLAATVNYIDIFGSAFWSYYDQQNHLATRKYHAFHVRQLDRYANHDDSGTLGRARDRMRMQLYVPLGVVERLVQQPSRLLFFLLAVFYLLFLPVVWLILTKRRRNRLSANRRVQS